MNTLPSLAHTLHRSFLSPLAFILSSSISVLLPASAQTPSAAPATTAAPTTAPLPVPRAVPSKVPERLPNGERAWEPLPQSEIDKLLAALPTKPATAPLKPRKLLVFYRTDGYPHWSIPHWNKYIELLGERTGAFTPVFSQNYADLTPENLAQFDALFLNNTCRMNTPEPVKAALQAFIKSGKGFAANHGAGDNWHDWPEGADMLGCEFVTHPFGRIHVKLDDPSNPLTRTFEGKSFPFSDEIYAFKAPYSRERLHVLLSIDYPQSPDVHRAEAHMLEKATRSDAAAKDKQYATAARADQDYALAWIRRWEQGRVFYCAFGHNAEVLFHPNIAQFFLAGIQYALGDLQANDAPSNPPSASTAPPQATPVFPEVRFAPEFDVVPFAAPPLVNSPVFLSASSNGAVYVSSDQNGSVGTQPQKGKIVRLRDLDGDGRADEALDFVPSVDAPRGIVADGNTVYVLHPPHLSAFIDKDGDGIADEERVLVKNIGWSYADRRADHGSNGLELGIDGWLYAAIGDFGIMKAEGTDGRSLQLRGGGVLRVRPDGTGLELYSAGTRNILEAAISPLLDGFARDNTNDGGGWDTRLHHFTGLEDHGYPRLYKNFAEEAVQPIADYGGGSGCGAAWISEPGWPAEWNHRPYTVDWGREIIVAHSLEPSGASFRESGPQRELAALITPVPAKRTNIFRPTDIDPNAQGYLFLASWKNGGFGAGPNVGSLYRLHPKGRIVPPLLQYGSIPSGELARLLASTSHRTRLDSQRELLRRPPSKDAITTLESIAKGSEHVLEARVAALFTLALWEPAKSTSFRQSLATDDPSIAAWAIRSLSDTAKPEAPMTLAPVWNGLQSSDARIRRESVFALARSASVKEASALVPLLDDADPRVAHMAWRAMASLNAHEACLSVLDDPNASPARRVGALRALQSLRTPTVVDALLARLTKETDPSRKRGLLSALSRLYNQEGTWHGDSWGTRPDHRGPLYQPELWAESAKIGAALAAAMRELSGSEAAWFGAELARNRVRLQDATQHLLSIAGKDPSVVGPLLRQLAESEDIAQTAIPFLIQVATDPEREKDLRNDAITALSKTDSREAFTAILKGFTLPAGGERYWNGRNAFLDAPHLENHYDLFIQEAEAMGKTAPQAEEALMKLLGRGFGAPEARAAALESVEKGWSNPKRQRQIIAAARHTRTGGPIAKKIAPLSQEPKGPQSELVELYFKDLRIKPTDLLKEVPPDQMVGAMPIATVLEKVAAIPGDKNRGEQLFTQQGCVACHTVKPEQLLKGPFLGTIANTYKRRELAESILEPSKSIAQGFATNVFTTKDGKQHLGFVVREAAYHVTFRTAAAQEVTLPTAEITKRSVLEEVSLMPPGLVAPLSLDEFASLLAYLEGLATTNKP